MKIKDLAKQHNLDYDKFEYFLRSSKEFRGYVRDGFSGFALDDSVCNKAVSTFLEEQRQRDSIKKENERINIEKIEKAKDVLLTSGFNFEGYSITQYAGVISCDDGDHVKKGEAAARSEQKRQEDVQRYLDARSEIRDRALEQLKRKAALLGCNAVIGVDFDYMTLDSDSDKSVPGLIIMSPYFFCVTARGVAVVVEKKR